VFVLGGIALTAGVAVFGAQLFSSGGSSIGFPSNHPSAAPSGGTLGVAGSHKNERIACNDSKISVSGSSNTVVLTGHCASVTVSGTQNVVTVDAADTISASGFENRVTFHSGSPRINKSGSGNVVEEG
jgi:hypothetical protein